MVRLINALFAVTVMIIGVMCAFMVWDSGKIDLKLVFAAISACAAIYSMWQLNLREADPRLIGIDDTGAHNHNNKRLLIFYNNGAQPTCLGITQVTSRNASLTYTLTYDLQELPGHVYCKIPIQQTISDCCESDDTITIEYVYYLGTRRINKRKSIIWRV
ncbi:MAG: hypothetical protein NT018_07940 [Armatimonadetes bacterium]|nr:hypothetical protein [Armatimonadota bacterium]